jgi:hypothetical protein
MTTSEIRFLGTPLLPNDISHIHSFNACLSKRSSIARGIVTPSFRRDVDTRQFLYLIMSTNITSRQDYPGNRVTITFEKRIVREQFQRCCPG